MIFLKRFFNQEDDTMTATQTDEKPVSALDALNAQISDAQDAAKTAAGEAEAAEARYRAAVQAGDAVAADLALQEKAAAERKEKFNSDRAEALAEGRENAEKTDRTPAALEALAAAQKACDREAQLWGEWGSAVEALVQRFHELRGAVADANTALISAHELLKEAHLGHSDDYPGVTRERISYSNERLLGLARHYFAPQESYPIQPSGSFAEGLRQQWARDDERRRKEAAARHEARLEAEQREAQIAAEQQEQRDAEQAEQAERRYIDLATQRLVNHR